MSKVIIPEPKSKGRYGPDVSWIHEEGTALRDAMTGCYVTVMSYPGAPIPSTEERDNWFPDDKYFVSQRFVDALSVVGWEFHGTRYKGRKPMSKWRENEFAKDVEEIPEDLERYTLQGEDDLPRILHNAQKRMQIFNPIGAFGSPRHGGYLSQELYEAGWYWLANNAIARSDVRSIYKVWKEETLPLDPPQP